MDIRIVEVEDDIFNHVFSGAPPIPPGEFRVQFFSDHIWIGGFRCPVCAKNLMAKSGIRNQDGSLARPNWTMESRDPLTLSPSYLHKSDRCGGHWFIREGKFEFCSDSPPAGSRILGGSVLP